MRDEICLSFDVEWACEEVVADIVRLLDEYGAKGTFFCTHPGVKVPGHERAIHPTYRFQCDTLKAIRAEAGPAYESFSDSEIYSRVLQKSKEFAPESIGARSHSLFYDSLLMPLYPKFGLKYDSSYSMPLQENIHAFGKEFGVIELPIYYMDFFDLKTQAVGFDLKRLKLERPGMKVLDFHPNLIFANISKMSEYEAIKPHYTDAAALLRMRGKARGTRTLFVEVLEYLRAGRRSTSTLAEIANALG